MSNLKKLYEKPLPSSRSGAFYNAFSYPTKISPEAIAVYIACATKTGDTVLDAFAGSGSTGMAALLCEHPTQRMHDIAKELEVSPEWGARNAILYEIGTYASFATQTMLNRLTAKEYQDSVNSFIKKASDVIGTAYSVPDPDGNTGTVRYIIWSDVLRCPSCDKETSYFNLAMSREPATFKKVVTCPCCEKTFAVDEMPCVIEDYYDAILGYTLSRKKRVPAWVYGITEGHNWDRPARPEDSCAEQCAQLFQYHGEAKEIKWGELHRSGYHYGVSHLHHFYTERNYLVMSALWKLTQEFPERQSNALKLLLLSYNAAHCTLMTRVVAKKNTKDFVLTGAQSGVLYISKAPVEKNILLGLRRKAKPFVETYAALEKCTGNVLVHNSSSAHMKEPDASIDYVFTDPPFGDFIPYAEVNQINELWLENVTKRSDEVIISESQGKDIATYQEMLTDVFKEIYRTLKPHGLASVVFHAAKAKVWECFSNTIDNAGFQIALSNVLDKTQASFKQVVSEGAVRGDPLFLLKKDNNVKCGKLSDKEILDEIIKNNLYNDGFDMRRCYSTYVYTCLEQGITVTMDAKQVYNYYSLARGVGA